MKKTARLFLVSCETKSFFGARQTDQSVQGGVCLQNWSTQQLNCRSPTWDNFDPAAFSFLALFSICAMQSKFQSLQEELFKKASWKIYLMKNATIKLVIYPFLSFQATEKIASRETWYLWLAYSANSDKNPYWLMQRFRDSFKSSNRVIMQYLWDLWCIS